MASVAGTFRWTGPETVEHWRVWLSGGVAFLTYGAAVAYSLITLTDPEIVCVFKDKRDEGVDQMPVARRV